MLPITPMLDMSFQLLAFFILTFRPPSANEGSMDVSLPAVGAAKAASPADVDPFAPSDTDVELPADVTISVTAQAGTIGRIAIREKETTTEVPGIAELRAALAVLRQQIGAANIKIEADSTLKYAHLIEVMDATVQSGFKSASFAPPPDLVRPK